MKEKQPTIRLTISQIKIDETIYPVNAEILLPLVCSGDGDRPDWRLQLREECSDLQGRGRHVRLARAMLVMQRKGLAPRAMIPYGEGAKWCEELSKILGWKVNWPALNYQINHASNNQRNI